MADLAVRAYRHDHGSDPGRLADLVPRYLAAVPQDPFVGRDLVYKAGDPDFLLYSLGPDRRDDGGQPLPEKSYGAAARGDLLIDPGPNP